MDLPVRLGPEVARVNYFLLKNFLKENYNEVTFLQTLLLTPRVCQCGRIDQSE